MPEYRSSVFELPPEPPISCISTGPIFKKMKVLKKFKKKIGLSSSCRDTQQPPLAFHSVHGDNIRLENNFKVARRSDSFCKGVVFSSRSVKVGERIYIRLLEISTNWSGVIRFGLTTQDPAGLRDALPKYVCPDLTNKPGYWAKALSERHAQQGLILYYYVTGTGDVHFGIEGEEKGVFFSGVETRSPLWSVIDVYGNCTAIEYLDPCDQLNNRLRIVNNLHTNPINPELRNISHGSTLVRPPSSRPPPPPPPFCFQEEVSSQLAQLGLHSDIPGVATLPQHFPSEGITPFPFHRVKGRNVTFNNDRTVVTRTPSEYSQGYVFSARPIRPGEHFVIQVLQTHPAYVGALAFGMTSTNPAGLDANDLPEDCDALLDRPEYWVVSKDVASSPTAPCEIAFGLSTQGEVLMSKGGRAPQVIMHVDHSQQLWAFCDLFGNTSKLRILGILPESTPMCFPVLQRNDSPPLRTRQIREAPPSPPSYSQLPPQTRNQTIVPPVADRLSPQSPMNTPHHECTICYEASVDSVLYSCGHMCMCYECALQQWRGRGGGHCPICRAVIRDVIRTYRS